MRKRIQLILFIFIKMMEVNVNPNQKKKSLPRARFSEEDDDDVSSNDEMAQEKKIKRLTQINRQLIEKLKHQNEELTKRINKQKFKPNRSLSVKTSQKNTKQIESVKKQLENAYKQIDMYKAILTNLKAKEISIESTDKIKQLENKIKEEDMMIDQYQKEIKYIANIREQQEKQLKIYENDQVKHSVAELQREINSLKEKLKSRKKTYTKRDQVEKKQHAYQLQLQLSLRKLNDDYYPGKVDKPEKTDDDERQITEREWQIVKSQLSELKKTHEDNTKKIQNLNRQKLRELKSADENELKIKEKNRKLQTIRSKVAELSKLVAIRDKKKSIQEESIGEMYESKGDFERKQVFSRKKEEKKNEEKQRDVKKWMIPQGYCLEKGKIMPDSIFFSDKTALKESKKTKIVQVNIWSDAEDNPCVLQFIYENELSQKIQGIQPIEKLPPLELSVLKLKEKDYLNKIKVVFFGGELVGVELTSKYGKEVKIVNENVEGDGESFVFQPRPNEIPSLAFGAYIVKDSREIRVCHLGIEFMKDW